MNFAIILAGGVGQRMRNSGLPKQFLEVFGKPIIIYTLEKFADSNNVDHVIVACNASWIDYMKELINKYNVNKIQEVVSGGKTRQDSIKNGLKAIIENGGMDTDIVVIHDGVRPLVEPGIINESIRVAQKYGGAMTVKAAVESVIITDKNEVDFSAFKKRDDTYSLTSPQTFKLEIVKELYLNQPVDHVEKIMPLLDAALAYTAKGGSIHIIEENNNNLKITTPEDYYIMKAMLELEEGRKVFGI